MQYIVKPGDTFWTIAQKFGVSLEELEVANPHIKNPDLIFPGQVINLPHGMPFGDLPHVPEPYPEVRVEGKNLAYARLIHEDYAGLVSEVTAIMQYVHHHLEMENTPGWREVAELEKEVSIVEMHHMEMLGQLLILLGSAPRYMGKNGRQWKGNYVSYHDFDPCSQLRADIQAEENAIRQYEEHVKKIEDHYIRQLLCRIIKDEELHKKLFIDAFARLCK